MININSISNIYSDGSDRINQKQVSKSAKTRAEKKKAVALVINGQTVAFVANLMGLKIHTLTSWVKEKRNGKY